MGEMFSDVLALSEGHSPGVGFRPVSGAYAGTSGSKRLELRVDSTW
jgi:hypothetical protein